MVNIQQWLKSQEIHNTELREIYLTEPNLEGVLNLGEFISEWRIVGLKIYLYPTVDTSKITFTNQPSCAEIIELVNAQAWLDANYPQEGVCCDEKSAWGEDNANFGKKRSEITELYISKKNLVGSLKIEGFSILTNLGCSINELTYLDLDNCSNLTILNCSHNQLTNLTMFSKLVNCRALYLDNNPLTGSLVALQNLSRLETLSIIKHTKITEGLEYLPVSLEKFWCDGQLAEQLANYELKYNEYNYQAWRKDHPELIANAQGIIEWEPILDKLVDAVDKLPTLNNKLLGSYGKGYSTNPVINQGLKIFIMTIEGKISELKVANKRYYQQPKIELPPK